MKKRSFLLLEVLIAFVLLSLCLVPLITQPLRLYKGEMAYLETMELERLADWTFTEVKEILLKHEIPLAKIPSRYQRTELFSLPAAQIEIPGKKKVVVERKFLLKTTGEKEKNDILYRQIEVYIYLNDRTYTFRLPIQSPKVRIE